MTVKEAYYFLQSRWLMVVVGAIIAACCGVWVAFLPLPEVPQDFRGIVFPGANLWIADPYVSMGVNMAVVAGIALLMGGLNRTYSLQRTQSALDSSFFLAMMLGMPTLLLDLNSGTVLALVVLVCLFLLYSTYADPDATRRVFLIFLILSGMSMTQYCYLFYIPVFIIGVMQMRIFTARTLTACLLGLVTPWWILGALSFVIPVTVRFPDLSQFLTAFSFQANLRLMLTILFIALLMVLAWVGNIPQMIAYNAHRRAYNGALSVLSLVTLLIGIFDFLNFSVYAPLLAVCASFQTGRLLCRRATKGNNLVVCTLMFVFFVIFLCYPTRLMWL